MFKKLKDKLAEEVKSSPQRIQQFAQAAQAAVTSASSSISDITNNDLFSIGDNDTQKASARPQQPLGQNAFQDVSLAPHSISFTSNNDSMEYQTNQTSDVGDNPRQRRLSNSSFASDVSFKLPSYESPSMYHLQSDMDVSASEAEERGLASPGGVSLERVTKEQLYAAYRRTQDRYGKYRAQYADLARHYKILERDNAKARSVLVETQDKALRRISELREQCSLEQSAKAHLERALRLEIDEKNMKIEALSTKVKLLQTNDNNGNENDSKPDDIVRKKSIVENDAQLIDFSVDNRQTSSEATASEITALNNKIEKMEQLINKYKESLKAIKEKNSQLTTELQVVSNELDIKTKDNEQLKATTIHLTNAREKIQELKDINEELQNKINTYDFSKTKEISTMEIDLQKAQDEIVQLQSRIDVLSKREEENAISLAENKLSIHKELESKETEIKSLKESLSACKKEMQSLTIVIKDYKKNISQLEEERSKLNNEINEINQIRSKIIEKDAEIKELKTKCQSYEQMKAKRDEEYKCLELQVKQETAEKLAMLDRNAYLEDKNKHISEENSKKSAQITCLESELNEIKRTTLHSKDIIAEKNQILNDVKTWKEKCKSLEMEIQEERVELVNLQSEIEKLLSNYELVQKENSSLNSLVSQLKSENFAIQEDLSRTKNLMRNNCEELKNKICNLRGLIFNVNKEIEPLKNFNSDISNFGKEVNNLLKTLHQETKIENMMMIHYDELKVDNNKLKDSFEELKERYDNGLKQVASLDEEKQTLNKLVETEKNINLQIQQQFKDLNDQYFKKLEDNKIINNETQSLKIKLDETEKRYADLQSTIQEGNTHNKSVAKELNALKSEKVVLEEKVKEQELAYKSCLNELNVVKMDLQTKIKNLDDNKIHALTLDKNIKDLMDENTSLKNKFEDIVINFKVLENELADVRRSHSEIEQEKDRLNSAIEVFENRELNVGSKETQTSETLESWEEQLKSALDDNLILKTKCEQVKQEKEELYEKLMVIEQKLAENESIIEEKRIALEDCASLSSRLLRLQNDYETQKIELNSLKDKNQDLSNKLSDREINVNELNYESLEKYDQIKDECESLREDNRRLQSDIEGLQSYLTKISKENSVLNDKLREVIASSENADTNDNSVLLEDITKLRNEIQSEKEKSDNLLRENTLLSEENMEFKDQLQSQNCIHTQRLDNKPGNETELSTLKDKYNNLLKLKHELETKLGNTEIANTNLKQLQDSNHKLRSTNDKLERRLDEALVSLRHLHSLQENTELEYLKNILYEYLTGSGTHSITLAKVLAAVVKFDDNQTQHVLQKEKERQGVLRQLGLL